MIKEIQLSEIHRGLRSHKISNTRTPILAYCRLLLILGEAPDVSLHVYRDSVLAVTVRTIKEGASLTVDERETPKFVKYKEFKKWS